MPIQLLHPPFASSAPLVHPSLGLNPTLIQGHAPDEHWLCTNEAGQLLARGSLWWRHVPAHPKQRLGLIGHYAADPAGDAPAHSLLRHAMDRLRQEGCTLAVGPMDGNTWHAYRYVTERGSEPPFFLEPHHPEAWPRQWIQTGFTPLASYFSALGDDLARTDPQVTRAGQRLAETGITHRPLSLDQWESELRLLFQLTLRSFQANFLYTPISEKEFMAQYQPMADRLRPELVRLAEQNGQAVGYVFALPDWAEAARGEPVRTIIVKTLAVLPERRCAGLGAWLLAEVQRLAHSLGFTRVIHALMHESNASLNLSGRYATIFRKYQLFAHPL